MTRITHGLYEPNAQADVKYLGAQTSKYPPLKWVIFTFYHLKNQIIFLGNVLNEHYIIDRQINYIILLRNDAFVR